MVDKPDSTSTDKSAPVDKSALAGRTASDSRDDKPTPSSAPTNKAPVGGSAITGKPVSGDPAVPSPDPLGTGSSGPPPKTDPAKNRPGPSLAHPVSSQADRVSGSTGADKPLPPASPPPGRPGADLPANKAKTAPGRQTARKTNGPGGPGGGSVKLEKPNKRFLLSLGGVVFSLLVLFALANYVVPRVLVSLTRAARTGDYSPANSYVFASPITAKADGQQKVQVNVFLLDNEGHGVSDQPVGVSIKSLAVSAGVPQVRQVQPTTNKNGQAAFEVTSTFPGQFEITANVGGVDLPQAVSVVFKK